MLVLRRKRRQTIKVGDIIVTVVNIGFNDVQIGIDAPRDVSILRGELEGRPKRDRRDDEDDD